MSDYNSDSKSRKKKKKTYCQFVDNAKTLN